MTVFILSKFQLYFNNMFFPYQHLCLYDRDLENTFSLDSAHFEFVHLCTCTHHLGEVVLSVRYIVVHLVDGLGICISQVISHP